MTTVLYGCVMAAAIVRVIASFAVSQAMPLLILSACFWIAAFLLFLWRYVPMLLPHRGRRPGPT
jgi:uncharacterized protein involved in response to NO